MILPNYPIIQKNDFKEICHFHPMSRSWQYNKTEVSECWKVIMN